ncbi:MAG: ABC transporter permease [Myxococcales bacterium]|nr:ABC transporter permease [Myxococcales bacterium]MCB9702817.1 ABC transporter permease [Myxococcales bacterium]
MHGPRLSTLAWRNIWRNRRRTVITLFSISFGVLLAVMFTGIGDSSYGSMIDHAASLGGGHVVVQHPDYAETPSLKKSVQGATALRERALADPEVERAVVRVSGATMLSTSANSTGAMILGIDPAIEDDTTLRIIDALAEGELFKSADDKGIILGATMAENLGVGMGKKVVITVTDKRGEIASGLARVSGIVRTGSPTIDGGICLMPINRLRALLGYAPDEATQLAVFVDDHRDAAAVAARLAGEADGAAVLTWDQAQPDLAGFITMKTTSTVILEGIITVLIAAGIFNTLFVSVMERLREFGIMAAIGFSSGQLFALVIWESFWIALCGLFAGVLLTAYPYHYLSTVGLDYSKMIAEGVEVAGVGVDPILYVRIYGPHALIIAAAIFLATMTAGLYPAWRAGRVAPVETIRIV